MLTIAILMTIFLSIVFSLSLFTSIMGLIHADASEWMEVALFIIITIILGLAIAGTWILYNHIPVMVEATRII